MMFDESLTGLTELESALEKHATFIVGNEHRTFSFLDFLHFEVGGKEYTMTHGTIRNKISKLRERGLVELAYNSGIAFYTLKGVHFGKTTEAANPMTPTHIPVPLLLKQHIHRVPGIKKHPLYKCLKHHPFDKAAVHDVQLKFVAGGMWYILYNNDERTSNIILDPYSKDIRLEKRVINELEIQVTIHHTDTVTVVVGCSNAPIAVDVRGVIRLSEALSDIEEELSRLIKQHTARGTNSSIEIPNHMSWIVTRWDFGVDTLVTYTGEKFFFSWQTSQNLLLIFYTKQWGKNNYRERVELQEFPDKPLGRALRERLNPRKGS